MKIPQVLKPWMTCTKCPLGQYADKHVIGRGLLPCRVMFLGESPGKSENAIGEAFVGRAGKLLDDAIGDAGGINRRFFFANLTMCRGTDGVGEKNRAPTSDEIRECLPRLVETIRLGKPRLVICCGKVPEDAWHDMIDPALRRASLEVPKAEFVAHPAYILRQCGGKGPMFNQYGEQIKHYIRRWA